MFGMESAIIAPRARQIAGARDSIMLKVIAELRRRPVKRNLRLILLAGLLPVFLAGGERGQNGLPATRAAGPYISYLPAVFSNAAAPVFDMVNFMVGNGRLYEVRHSGGSQARHQTQIESGHFYHTKGNEFKAEWEELWSDGGNIFRGTDTSPGNDQYYTLFENGVAGSAWSPRYWRVGDLFERNPYVVFFRKNDCQVVASGYQKSWLRFEGYYPTYTFESGIKVSNVIELTWLLSPQGEPVESYFYAATFGLVGWGSSDRGYSYINEIHAPGQRPDNKREKIGCLNASLNDLSLRSELNFGPLPPGFRAK